MTSIIPIKSIVSKILFFRGEKVLLDRDLAKLYGVEAKVLTRISQVSGVKRETQCNALRLNIVERPFFGCSGFERPE
ncbi:MAG: hypothetical protein DRH10_06930 [Deltaproteobacteria bacterium]|nr:MAG: hypothetical protein DRH10_06930 [Deltaproteobacteria bacterium]